MSRRLYVGLRGLAKGAEIRRNEFEGRDHLIVPVVMMIGDAVVRPLGSTAPEFVPAEELAALPDAWNGEPVMTNHPEIDGRAVSANIPAVLETMAFGQCFNTAFRNGSLQTEAWLDLTKAAALGGDAEIVVERVEAGETIEISVGCWITAIHETGESPSGESYEMKWSEIAPDHLAILPVGTEGACSVEMGCGTPRAARSRPGWTRTEGRGPTNRDRPGERILRAAEEESTMDWRKLLTALRALPIRTKTGSAEDREYVRAIAGSLRAAQEAMSDGDLWASLWRAIEGDVPAFDWIEDVFSADGIVVYTTWPPEEGIQTWRRGFTVADSGEVTLAEEAEQVHAVTRYEPVAAAEDGGQSEPDEKTNGNASEGCSCQTPKGETPTMNETIKALIARLTDGSLARSPFSAECAEALAAFDEPKLQALAESFTDPEKPVVEPEEPEIEPKPETEPILEVDPDAVTLSRQEHETLTALARESEERNAAERIDLVSRLVTETGEGSRPTFTAMDLRSLRQLATDLKVNEPKPDFSLAQHLGDPGDSPDAVPAAPRLLSKDPN